MGRSINIKNNYGIKMNFKTYLKENNTWTKDIFSNKKLDTFVALFINKSTNTLFASVGYTDDLIKHFVDEKLKESRGKITLLEVLSEKDFNKKYKRVQYISGISMDIVVKK